MSALVRLSSGQFKLVDSVNLDKLLYKNLEEHIISLKTILNNFEVVNLDDNYYKDLINGVKIPYKKEGEFLLYCKNELFGIARVEEGILKVKVYLKA
jgi:tRNA U55 pseudouridine synthase TruB